MKDSLVSVIVASHNGERFLEDLMNSISNTNYNNFEVIFVDNASTDRSLEIVRKFKKKIRLKVIKNEKNLGYAAGCNIGAEHASGEFLVFMNADIRVDKNWLKELVNYLKKHENIGIAQAKLLQFKNPKLIDSFGCYIDCFGFAYEDERGTEDVFKLPREIFYANGATIVVRRKIYEELKRNGMEIFNPKFFIYSEDLEASWKARLLGYKIVVVPSSIVFHKRGASNLKTIKPNLLFLSVKNKISTLLECYSSVSLLITLPFSISFEILRSIFYLFSSTKHTLAIWKGICWNIANIPSILKEREKIQKIRRVSDHEILKIMKKFDLRSLINAYRKMYIVKD
ncbi:MAG: glycosyltransferase family 2 protein [Candidatus Aenigmatarchaeota archaeon]